MATVAGAIARGISRARLFRRTARGKPPLVAALVFYIKLARRRSRAVVNARERVTTGDHIAESTAASDYRVVWALGPAKFERKLVRVDDGNAAGIAMENHS